MSKAIITEQHLHDIADAIIAKGGATAPMTPAQMPAAIAAIPSGGGDLKDFIEGNLTEFDDATSTTIRPGLFYAFNYVATKLPAKVRFRNVVRVIGSVFYQAGFEECVLDIATTLGVNVFYYNQIVKTVRIPSVSSFEKAFNSGSASNSLRWALSDIWVGDRTGAEIVTLLTDSYPFANFSPEKLATITFHGAEIAGTGTRHCAKYIDGAWVATTEPMEVV